MRKVGIALNEFSLHVDITGMEVIRSYGKRVIVSEN
jgi:hypothetical protein